MLSKSNIPKKNYVIEHSHIVKFIKKKGQKTLKF